MGTILQGMGSRGTNGLRYYKEREAGALMVYDITR